MTPVAVLVVDDHAVFRHAAATLIRSLPQLRLAGQAGTGEQAVTLARRLRPAAVLMDVRLPGIDGVEATRQILTDHPDTRIVLISTYEPADLPTGVCTCGAQAFLRKQDLDAPTLLRIINHPGSPATARPTA